MATLREIIDQLDEFGDDEELTIFAEGGPEATLDSLAAVAAGPEDGSIHHPELGLDYVLELDHAREAIHVWRLWRDGAEPSLDEKCSAVLYYARNDAFQPTD